MGKLIYLDGLTRNDLTAERILDIARDADLDGLVIMGYTKDGDEYFVSSYADGGTCLWLIERLKIQLMKIETNVR